MHGALPLGVVIYVGYCWAIRLQCSFNIDVRRMGPAATGEPTPAYQGVGRAGRGVPLDLRHRSRLTTALTFCQKPSASVWRPEITAGVPDSH